MEKVLLVTPYLSRLGGIANYYNVVLPYLRKSKEVEVRVLEVGRHNSSFALKDIIRPLRDQYRFLRVVKEGHFDVVHISPSIEIKSFFRDGLFVRIAKNNGSKVIVFFRGWRKHFETKVTRFFLPVFKKTHGLADAFIVLSSEFKQVLREWGVTRPIYLETTVVDDGLINCFDLQRKLEAIQTAGVHKILFLSRVEKAKGIFELIEAIRLLLHSGYRVSLTIAGDGKALSKIKRTVRREEILSKNVAFTGFISGKDKIQTLITHHIFCLPSYSEGLPNALLEAMATGLIPVITSMGGIKEFFDDKMGFLIFNNNPEELANALKKAIDLSFEQKKGMLISNRHLIEKKCMASCASERLISLYKSLFI